ncbi:MAG: ferritin-like domain-containing protein [Chitinophagaceae bacterium]
METNEKLVGVLNDLIQINNDRVVGYEKAADEATNIDVDLKAIFNSMADKSRKYAAELTSQVLTFGGDPDKGTTGSGKIYRAWMDVKAVFTGKDRHAILASCERGEDAAQRAYQEALASDAPMSTDIRQLIADQKDSLKKDHDKIKSYRDMQGAVS